MFIPSSLLIQFQPATREDIAAALEEIQAEWTAQGIETPVIDEDGALDPDARAELADRL